MVERNNRCLAVLLPSFGRGLCGQNSRKPERSLGIQIVQLQQILLHSCGSRVKRVLENTIILIQRNRIHQQCVRIMIFQQAVEQCHRVHFFEKGVNGKTEPFGIVVAIKNIDELF